MIFAELPVGETEGAILAHSIRLPTTSFKKGRRLSAEDVAALIEAGRTAVIVARLEPGDVGENEAATRVAAAIQGAHLARAAAFTGRCNLLAETAGVLVVDRERVDRINLLDESVTIATLQPYDPVEPRQMAATVKIIPFAVAEPVLARCETIAREGGPLLRIAAFRPRPVGLIQTRLPGVKESVLDKTVRTMNARLAALGCGALAVERRCSHDEAAVAAEIDALRGGEIDLLLLLGASAITDRRDVIPTAIERLGGRVEHFGMPVDPGNLLLLARLGGMEILGVPGSTRSPKLSGVDWVLRRLLADIPVKGRDIMRMGVGGLLKEIPSRPQPRAGVDATAAEGPRAPRIAAILLAAGRSSRMGTANKLLTEIDGVAMAARAVEAALASQADPIIVVTGHEAERVTAAIETAAAGRPVAIVHNPDYAAGISSSLRRGLSALESRQTDGTPVDGALICLADMPRVSPTILNRLIAAFNPVEGHAICVPVWNGKRGNPVLWSRRFFPEMSRLAGDVGARHLIGEYGELVCEVTMTDDAVLIDVDTPEALAALARRESV